MQQVRKAREFLLAQLEPLEREEAELQQRVAAVQAEKEPLVKAIKALEAETKRRPAKPAVKKEDVQPVIVALAKDNPGIDKEALEGLVEEKLVVEQGFSRNGLKMQIRKCLGSELFQVEANGTVTVAEAGSSRTAEHGISDPASTH